ncbi:MAG: Ig-like domain-containing protein [Flavobacteriales bacterium]|nr:Ig-like domain-containing protein [Flavobacteriales bacterium]
MKKLLQIFIVLLLTSCANMVVPTGGDKDIKAPELQKINSAENLKHVDEKIVSFDFDEFIVLNKWEENFYISPPINKRIKKKIKGTELFLTIEDTLAENTTYNLALSSCIKDLNEGNILDTLNFTFSTSDVFDTLTLSGKLQDAYTLDAMKNAWIMLFEENRNDTIIFKENPNYIAKTDKNGNFHFPNLNTKNYKVVALTEFDFIYNEDESIAFLDSSINAATDSFVSLFSFNPIIETDSTNTDTSGIITDSIATDSLVIDTLLKEEISYGKLEVINNDSTPCIFQLLQNKKVVKEFSFNNPPYVLDELIAGKYQLKYIADSNIDNEWTTGNWLTKTQAEKVKNYPSEITIRANWDLELEWLIEE